MNILKKFFSDIEKNMPIFTSKAYEESTENLIKSQDDLIDIYKSIVAHGKNIEKQQEELILSHETYEKSLEEHIAILKEINTIIKNQAKNLEEEVKLMKENLNV